MHKTGDGKRRKGLGFMTTAALDAQRLPPLLSLRVSYSKGEQGCHLREGLRDMKQALA